ncbi:MAG: YkgJ family cysteine cluster protein [Myxococcales bacterium]|nr:YkgJ family cysteine cluster protein [Myxococcales bacterium]
MSETRAIYRMADRAYAAFSCQGTAECCSLTKTGRQPWLWPTEWMLLARAVQATPPRPDGGCPFLDSAGRRCFVYSDRPFGCRTYYCDRATRRAREPSRAVAQLLSRLASANLRLDAAAKPLPLLQLVTGPPTGRSVRHPPSAPLPRAPGSGLAGGPARE